MNIDAKILIESICFTIINIICMVTFYIIDRIQYKGVVSLEVIFSMCFVAICINWIRVFKKENRSIKSKVLILLVTILTIPIFLLSLPNYNFSKAQKELEGSFTNKPKVEYVYNLKLIPNTSFFVKYGYVFSVQSSRGTEFYLIEPLKGGKYKIKDILTK